MNIISIVALLAVVSLVVFLRIRSSRKRREIMKELHDFAHLNGCIITESDCWKGMHTITKIGVDTHNRKLFFMRTVRGSVSTFFVDLNDIKRVTKDYTQRSVGEGKEKSTVMDSLGLAISYIDAKRKDDFLEFFNTQHDFLRADGEIQLAEKWEDSLSHLVGLRPQ